MISQILNTIYNFMDYGFVQSFVANLLATVVGVALGIPIAFWINRQVDRGTEKKMRERVLNTFLFDFKELQARAHLLKSGDPLAFVLDGVNDSAWKSASEGGELKWVRNYDLLIDIRATYLDTRDIEQLAYKYNEMLKVKNSKKSSKFKALEKELSETCIKLGDSVGFLIQEMEEELQDPLR